MPVFGKAAGVAEALVGVDSVFVVDEGVNEDGLFAGDGDAGVDGLLGVIGVWFVGF